MYLVCALVRQLVLENKVKEMAHVKLSRRPVQKHVLVVKKTHANLGKHTCQVNLGSNLAVQAVYLASRVMLNL